MRGRDQEGRVDRPLGAQGLVGGDAGGAGPARLLRFWSEVLERADLHGDRRGRALDFGEGVGYLAVQKAEVYEPPVWPPEPGKQGMQMHLDIEVSDLAAAVEHALELGATLAEFQPQDDVRVLLDPAGHPFCLYT